jgi:hypothetical protein
VPAFEIYDRAMSLSIADFDLACCRLVADAGLGVVLAQRVC